METEEGQAVGIMASVRGAGPSPQELAIKGTTKSRRISEFFINKVSDGVEFLNITEIHKDSREISLTAQLTDLPLSINGQPNRLATLDEPL